VSGRLGGVDGDDTNEFPVMAFTHLLQTNFRLVQG